MSDGPSLIGTLVDKLTPSGMLKNTLGFLFDAKALESGGAAFLVDKVFGESTKEAALGGAVGVGLEKLGLSRIDAGIGGIGAGMLDKHPILGKLLLGYVAFASLKSHPMVSAAALETIAITSFKDHPVLAIAEGLAGMAVGAYGAFNMVFGAKPSPSQQPALAT